MEPKDPDEYEEKIIDIDEITGTDIKINPDYYIHLALVNYQQALKKDNPKEGMILARQYIEHIENLAISAGMLPENYDQDIKEYKTKDEYTKAENDFSKSMRLANYKLRLIMKEVFKRKTITNPLRY